MNGSRAKKLRKLAKQMADAPSGYVVENHKRYRLIKKADGTIEKVPYTLQTLKNTGERHLYRLMKKMVKAGRGFKPKF